MKYCNDSNAVFKYYGWCLWEYWWLQPKQKKKNFDCVDDMIADIMSNKKFQAIIKELFIRCRKLNISLVFITQSYFSVPKDVRLNSTHYLIMKSTTEKNYKIMQLIILQILITKILWRCTENAQKNHIFFGSPSLDWKGSIK